jgi:predicted MFS family arabinose efflux permease
MEQSTAVNARGMAGIKATHSQPVIGQKTVRLFALFCAVIVANIYYAQPLAQLIAPDLGLSTRSASFITSVTQIGFGLGVFFVVPLGDMVENRRLILWAMMIVTLGLLAAATVHHAWAFLAASLVIGLTSVCVQMIVPLAAHLSPEASRGRTVGNIMGGLTLGILLSRPVASVVADQFGWRAVFVLAACLMIWVLALSYAHLPRRAPVSSMGYGALIRSLVTLLRTSPELRRRAFYQGCLFYAFATFWSSVPLELSRAHGFSQTQIGFFTLMAAAGVIAGPLAGRLADAGYTRTGTRVAFCIAVAAILLGLSPWGKTVIGLAVTALFLDFAMQFSMVLGQRTIYALAPEQRSRLNALYMTSLFIGAACGSAMASNVYAFGGWSAIAVAASIPPIIGAVHSLLAYRA